MANGHLSRQIRPPIYSMKQTKLRRRRVVRYAILYFILLVVILALIVAPAVAGKYVPDSIMNLSILKSTDLMQPIDAEHDDTWGNKPTGTGAKPYTGVLASYLSSSARAAASATRKAGN